ncbi:MAG: hypothetical protein J7J67_03170 [Thermoproteales archaeon]|nr:hypothetical protein [Thermoproteales archaeon]
MKKVLKRKSLTLFLNNSSKTYAIALIMLLLTAMLPAVRIVNTEPIESLIARMTPSTSDLASMGICTNVRPLEKFTSQQLDQFLEGIATRWNAMAYVLEISCYDDDYDIAIWFYVVDDPHGFWKDFLKTFKLDYKNETIEGAKFLVSDKITIKTVQGQRVKQYSRNLGFFMDKMLIFTAITSLAFVNDDQIASMRTKVNRLALYVYRRATGLEEFTAMFTITPPQPTTTDQIVFRAQTSNKIAEYLWYLDGKYLSNVGNKPVWTWNNPAPGKHTVKLVIRDSKGNENQYTRSFIVNALKVSVSTQKAAYNPGEEAQLKIKVTYAGQPVQGARINITIYKPDGSTLKLPEKGDTYCCTNSQGGMTIPIQILSDAKTGEKWTIAVTATYQPKDFEKPVSAKTQLDLDIGEPLLLEIQEQVLQGGKLELKPLKIKVTVIKASGGKTTKEILETSDEGTISLLQIIRNDKGEIADGIYVVKLDHLPQGDQAWKEKWGTINKYPVWNDKMPPSIKIQVTSDDTKKLKHSITILATNTLWIKDPAKGLIEVDAKTPYQVPEDQNIIIVLRSLETWEQLVRSEVESFLVAAGVNPSTAQKIASTSIIYGVDCGMCGDRPCPGQYMPSRNAIGMSMPADKAYSQRGISIEYDFLGNLLHEFGHRVKENLLYDSGASLGGEHSSEYDPCPNLDTAYDEAFADLFPILVQSYSQALPSYVGLRYDRAAKVYGRHKSGKTGDYIEARIAGLWVSMYGLTYSGKTSKSAAALRDIIKTSLFFKATYGRPARTIGEWLTAKAFLDPTTIGKIQDIVKPEKYDIPVLYALDMPQAQGILRTQSGNGLSAFVIAYYMSAKLAPPSRLSYTEAREVSLKQAGVSTFPLKTGDEIHATGGFGLNDGAIYIKKTSEQGSQNMLKIDISAWRESHIKLLDSNTLYISNNLKAHIKKIGAGIPELKIKTDTATITAINSELLIDTSNNETTVTVLEGQVTVEAQNQQVTVTSGQQTLIKPGTTPTKPQRVDASNIQKWWTPYQPQEQAQKPQQPQTPQSKPQDIIQQIIKTLQNIVQQLIRTITEIIQQITHHQS